MSLCGRDKSQDERVDRMALVNFISGYLINELEDCSRDNVKKILAEISEAVMESFPDSENAAQESLPLDDRSEKCGKYYAPGGGKESLCPVDGIPKGCAVNCRRARELKAKK